MAAPRFRRILPSHGSLARGSVRRLVILFALLAIAPLALLTYLTIDLTDRYVVREVKARVQTTSAGTATLVEQQMQAVADLAASYATRPLLVAALGDGSPATYDQDFVDRQLGELLHAQVGSGGAFVTNTSCRLTNVRPATPSIVGRDFGFRDWCQGLTATGRPYVSDAYRSAITGRPLVVAAVVMVRGTTGDLAGKPLGIVGVVYTLASLRGYAAELARAQGVRLTITDKRGTVLVGSAGASGSPALASAAADPRVSEALAGRSGVTRSSTADGEVLAAFSPVKRLGWTVTAEIDARAALGGVRKLQSTVLTVAALLGLVLLGGIVALGRTLRQRREAERVLVERNAHTQAILEAATDAFVSMDASGVITAWNGQAYEIFGWTEGEALGRALTETIIPPSLRADHERGLARFLSTGVGHVLNKRIELTALHRDGHEFPVELAIWPVRSQSTLSFNAFVRDITARKHDEAELAKARDEALEGSRLKSEFLANMSHELRTPMNGVLGMTSLLLESNLSADQRDSAETVLTSGEALLGILNDILDFSKVEASHLELEPVDFHLRRLVENVVGLLAVQAHNKGLEFACSLSADLPRTVRADPGRVRQILINLIGNAIKFTEVGEVVLRVYPAEVAGVDPVVRFEIADTGDGLASDKLERIFQPFVQADTSISRKYGGTGLGLAISGQLVTQMGGDCGVTSSLGAGSTFWFTLPVLAEAEQPPSAAQTPDADLAGVRALIVDDNASQRDVLSADLAGWGMIVDSADSGLNALALLRGAALRGIPYAIALIDRSMPVMDGLELRDAILADSALDPRLVLVTRLGQERDLGAAEPGISATLMKPVRREHLHACLRVALGIEAADAASAEVTTAPAPAATDMPELGRLLLAEDNLVNQKVAVAMLSSMGYRVDTVLDGAAAVKAVASFPYDAVLMDCQMPELSGYEATVAIRAQEAPGQRVPIIALTAGALEEDRERCLAAGMDAYLSKPMTKDALLSLVAKSMKGSS